MGCAIQLILQHLSLDIRVKYKAYTNIQKLWKDLETKYAKDRKNIMFLLAVLCGYQWNLNHSIAKHIAKVNDIAQQLVFIQITITDDRRNYIVLHSLLEDFNYIK